MTDVSIIVPVYNVEEYLPRCLNSLTNQTLHNIEIILVDDGSPDNSSTICDNYMRADKRIKVIHKQNSGLGYARNSGLDIATGKYVAFVDSDDYVDLNMYKTLFIEAERTNSDAAFCGFKVEMDKNKWFESHEVNEDQCWEGKYIKKFMYDMIASGAGIKKERIYQMSVWHAIYRRKIIKENNILFPSEREVVSEDLPFHIDFLTNASRIYYSNKHFYYYCLNKSSLTATFRIEKYLGYSKLRKLLLLKNKDIEYRNRVNRLYVGYCRGYCYNLQKSEIIQKKDLLKKLLGNSTWITVKKEFSPSYLPIHTRFMYTLMSPKYIHLLRLFIIITSIFRNKRI